MQHPRTGGDRISVYNGVVPACFAESGALYGRFASDEAAIFQFGHWREPGSDTSPLQRHIFNACDRNSTLKYQSLVSGVFLLLGLGKWYKAGVNL
jgi:hypothetical protein